MNRILFLTKDNCVCCCFRHVIELSKEDLEIYYSLGFNLNTGNIVTKQLVHELFKLEHYIFIEHCKYNLQNLCYHMILKYEINTDKLPFILQKQCIRRKTYNNRISDIPCYFLSHIGCTYV